VTTAKGVFGWLLQHLERVIEIDPSYTDALNNLGTYYHRAGKYDQSIRYFKKVTDLDPDFYGGWVNLAGSLLAVGRFQDALEANLRAYSVRPNECMVISQIALNYYYLHDLSEAGKYFKKVLTLDPLSAVSPHLYLAHIALAEKNQAEAVDCIKEFLEIHPNAPEAPHLRETLAALSSQSVFEPGQVVQTKR
jgi:tetratricopeptide (TPR) repeat protein